MKDFFKYSFYMVLVAIPSFLILGMVAYWLVPDFFKNSTEVENRSRGYIEEAYNVLPYEIHYDSDSVKIASLYFPPEESYMPGITEVWRVNKLTGDSILCVKSNPRYFGEGSDSIPSIVRVWYRPDKEKLIVEGPTCGSGTMATYIVDVKNGEYKCLPTNYGFIGYTNWDDYLIASSKFREMDHDLLLIYENIYVLDWDGNIISEISTRDK